ncbi:MAG TPA: hypothetical protein VFS24_06275 [Steroidobacteraceae bacterium]|nr:hypothetical protein [Steroidobacteraceae bacterium]
MNARLVNGFDYRSHKPIARPMNEWRAEIERACAQGGEARRIAGDLTIFDKRGHMQFEVYDKSGGSL